VQAISECERVHLTRLREARLVMKDASQIKVEIIKSWDHKEIVDLYRSGGWWKDGMNPNLLGELIRGSFLFAVAVDISTSKAVGMGRVISDGIADAYVQDLVVQKEWKEIGVGKMILSSLLEECQSRNISWIGLIAEPGTDSFYQSSGFLAMKDHVPMLYSPETKKC
jgi:aralkylamine N-acetyltransferase